ncbi:hypothetical protein TIFTF001_041667 [Ficus carica]|uniref:Uncharacterized protein n=1 Tax=Ficus carica TaxID=3494 RepID=A0AA87ZF69_FICCA|nr:hypothetical protein TIFTF001_041667 [Ficus carica]
MLIGDREHDEERRCTGADRPCLSHLLPLRPISAFCKMCCCCCKITKEDVLAVLWSYQLLPFTPNIRCSAGSHFKFHLIRVKYQGQKPSNVYMEFMIGESIPAAFDSCITPHLEEIVVNLRAIVVFSHRGRLAYGILTGCICLTSFKLEQKYASFSLVFSHGFGLGFGSLKPFLVPSFPLHQNAKLEQLHKKDARVGTTSGIVACF